MEFTPPNAPAVMLLFLVTSLLCLAGTTAAVVLGLRGRGRAARRLAEGLVVVLVLYGGALLAHSLTSRDQILEPGQLKYLCELDCHLAYSVEGVRTSEVLGGGPTPTTAAGRFLIVTVKTWFDPGTISRRRGHSPLLPNRRIIRLEDASAASFAISREGEKALSPGSDPDSLLRRPLRPGESYRTDLVFDLPPGRENLRLLISEDIPEAPLIVSHENSLFHKKIWFRIPLEPAAGGPSSQARRRSPD